MRYCVCGSCTTCGYRCNEIPRLISSEQKRMFAVQDVTNNSIILWFKLQRLPEKMILLQGLSIVYNVIN